MLKRESYEIADFTPTAHRPTFCLIFSAAPQDSRHTQSAESYAVYSVLIPQIASVPPQKFLVAADIVLYSETKSQFPVEPENLVAREELKQTACGGDIIGVVGDLEESALRVGSRSGT